VLMKSIQLCALLLFLTFRLSCVCQTNTAPSRQFGRDKSVAYQAAVTTLLLSEASDYAASLNLGERLPITTNSVKEIFVSSPFVADRFGALGSLRTTNFSYGFGNGKHLCYITRIIGKNDPYSFEENKQFEIDPTALNTNGAFLVATQLLAKAFVDITRLSSSSTVSVEPLVILHMTTCKYTVRWQRDGKTIAKVVLVEPKKELWTLRIEDPSLILRGQLGIPDSNLLNSRTNVDVRTNIPVKL